MKKNIALFFIGFLIASFVQGQLLNDFSGIETRGKFGFLLPHRPVMHHLVNGHSAGFEISLVNQSDGSKDWHHWYNFPRNGFSLYYADLGNDEILGRSFGLFAFGELPIIELLDWKLNWRTGLGFSWLTKTFDQQKNPKNNAISTHLNSLVQMGITVNRQWDNFGVGIGLDMTHFSNGASKMPNLGLNIPALNIGMSYYLQTLNFQERKKNLAFANKNLEFRMFGNFSTKQVYPTGGSNYFVAGASGILHKRISRKVGLELMLDIFSNQSHSRGLDADSFTQWDLLQMGIFAAYVLPINKFSFFIGMGSYIKNDFNPDGWMYHRFGTRYQLSERLWANISLKSHWGRADYFEYGLVYKLIKFR